MHDGLNHDPPVFIKAFPCLSLVFVIALQEDGRQSDRQQVFFSGQTQAQERI